MALSTACPKPQPRLLEKAAKRASEAAEMRACYRAVDEREGYCCRVTGVHVNPQSPSMLQKGHHHHLIYRSRGGGHHTNNVVLVSAKVHLAIHAGELRLSGDADVPGGVKVERWSESGWTVDHWV